MRCSVFSKSAALKIDEFDEILTDLTENCSEDECGDNAGQPLGLSWRSQKEMGEGGLYPLEAEIAIYLVIT